MEDTAPLNWSTLFTVWDVPLTGTVLVVLAAGLYLWGVTRVTHWSIGHSTLYFCGLLVAFLSLGSSINAYSDVLFSMHMAQHLLLIMVVPALLILGRPLELLRRATSGSGSGIGPTLRRLRHGWFVTVITHPVFGLLYYAMVVMGTHLTRFQQYVLTHTWVHGLEEFLYVSSGFLLLLPVLGVEAVRNTTPHLLRIFLLTAAMLVDTVVGVLLMLTPTVRFPAYAAVVRDWGPSPLQDQTSGGAAMWIGGDGLMTVLAVIVIAYWIKAGSGSSDLGWWLDSARRSALANEGTDSEGRFDTTDDIDNDEDALRAYNAMLARLAESERSDRSGS